jgi:hypothetical protein
MSETTAAPAAARIPVEHRVKADPVAFRALRAGWKTSEVRWDDRPETYQPDDILVICEHRRPERYDVGPYGFTGEEERRRITHVQRGYGLPDGLVVLSLAPSAAGPGARTGVGGGEADDRVARVAEILRSYAADACINPNGGAACDCRTCLAQKLYPLLDAVLAKTPEQRRPAQWFPATAYLRETREFFEEFFTQDAALATPRAAPLNPEQEVAFETIRRSVARHQRAAPAGAEGEEFWAAVEKDCASVRPAPPPAGREGEG